MTARVSVAICTFNGAAYLREQLESLAEQSRPPDELVLSDDGSTDATLEIAREFARVAAFPVRIHVNAENLGSTRNFEQAMGLCRGELIFLCDQDDVWGATKIEKLLAVFARSPEVSVAFSDADVVDEDLRRTGRRLWETIGFGASEREAVRRGAALDVLLRHNVVTGATLAFRRELLAAVIPIPAIWIHDGWIALLAAAISRLAPVDEPLIAYRQHGANQVGARTRSLGEQIAGASVSLRSAYQLTAEQYAVAAERLATLLPEEARRTVLAKLDAKVAHHSRRGQMPASVVLRAGWVARELLTGRYRRYSARRCAVKDLVYGGRRGP